MSSQWTLALSRLIVWSIGPKKSKPIIPSTNDQTSTLLSRRQIPFRFTSKAFVLFCFALFVFPIYYYLFPLFICLLIDRHVQQRYFQEKEAPHPHTETKTKKSLS